MRVPLMHARRISTHSIHRRAAAWHCLCRALAARNVIAARTSPTMSFTTSDSSVRTVVSPMIPRASTPSSSSRAIPSMQQACSAMRPTQRWARWCARCVEALSCSGNFARPHCAELRRRRRICMTGASPRLPMSCTSTTRWKARRHWGIMARACWCNCS